MMKRVKFLMIALVAVLGLSSCEKDDNNHDHSADFVGTWTCLTPNLAEALVINADGSFVSTGLVDGNYWEDIAGKIVVEDGNVTLDFENGNNIKGHFDIIPGVAFSIYNEEGGSFTFNYCKEDLSEKIVGMWVSTDGPYDKENDMVIQTFDENGTVTKTGWSVASNEFIVKEALTYKVVGDLLFHQRPSDMVTEGVAANFASKLTYMPNANQLGDMLTNTAIKLVNGQAIELSMSMLRIKQSLDLTGKVYDYNSAYVSNAKGKDEDFNITGSTFNMANIKAGYFDMMFRSVLFCVEFPNASTIKQNFLTNGISTGFETPITVDGNKVTLDLSAANPAYRKVDMYMFQDADASQLHIYMPTSSFINYFANLEIVTLLTEGKIDPTDTAAVEKVYTNMEARVESINVSFVFKSRK